MEAIHVELANEAIDLIVAKISRKDNLLELVDILDDELDSWWGPICNFIELIVLDKITCTFKISKVLAMKPATYAV